jgi:hypothetical protein
MACVDLPPREARALRTLLRVASGKLGEAKAGIEAQNDGPSSAFLGVPWASIFRVGAARQMLGRQPDRSRPGDLEGGEELPLNRTRASSRPICRLTQLGGP